MSMMNNNREEARRYTAFDAAYIATKMFLDYKKNLLRELK